MKSLREQISSKCVHFNGMQHLVCEVGVAYDDVRDPAATTKWKVPCFTDGCTERCLRVQFPTVAEVDARLTEINAALNAHADRYERGECCSCGAKVETFVQSGKCAYAKPCGHRHGQADADALNRDLNARAAESETK